MESEQEDFEELQTESMHQQQELMMRLQMQQQIDQQQQQQQPQQQQEAAQQQQQPQYQSLRHPCADHFTASYPQIMKRAQLIPIQHHSVL